MKYSKYIPYAIIAILLVILFVRKSETITVTVPEKQGSFKVDEPKPIVIKDTIRIDGETKVIPVPNPINQKLLNEYQSLKDSVARLEFVKDAVTERTYKETFTDSTQTITVQSEVIGTLKSQKVDYRVFEQQMEIPIKKRKLEVYTGLFTGVPTTPQQNISIGANISLKAPKTIYSIGYDNQQNIYAGISIKLF
ncbi:hypothetical protein [Maribacter sp. 2210JD10-5]|uniref:hypothetical protein n=1 Tax=Maribacter sp. 2210JD10-5 TaxID=3386272 RepID=UPI0039BCF412